MIRRPVPFKPGPNQRSVWSFPRPPTLEDEPRTLRVVFGDVEIAATTRGKKVLETSHPPVYFFPADDVRMELLTLRPRTSFCEWKGEAAYFDIRVQAADGERVAESVAFSYPAPTARFRDLAGWISFYAGPLDACLVGDEQAEPQPGGFYSGWITRDVVGPFKGGPGTAGW